MKHTKLMALAAACATHHSQKQREEFHRENLTERSYKS